MIMVLQAKTRHRGRSKWTSKSRYRRNTPLCDYKKAEIVDGVVCSDYVHLCVSIPPKLAISEFVGSKGEKGIGMFDKHLEMGSKWNKSFWARGYYCGSIVRNITKN